MHDRGINVALGTDSADSAPDQNLMDDARLVHRLRPDITEQTLFEMMTVRGAKALGLEHSVGQLKPGMRANYCAFAIKGGDPFLELLESDACAQAAAP
jgi:cytosine/adenosine deaminase-related metal-dependent hydrolase